MMPSNPQHSPDITQIPFSLVIEDGTDKTPHSDWIGMVKNLRYAINEHHCLGGICFFGGNQNFGPEHRRVAWVGICAHHHIDEMRRKISEFCKKCPDVTLVFISGGVYEKL